MRILDYTQFGGLGFTFTATYKGYGLNRSPQLVGPGSHYDDYFVYGQCFGTVTFPPAPPSPPPPAPVYTTSSCLCTTPCTNLASVSSDLIAGGITSSALWCYVSRGCRGGYSGMGGIWDYCVAPPPSPLPPRPPPPPPAMVQSWVAAFSLTGGLCSQNVMGFMCGTYYQVLSGAILSQQAATCGLSTSLAFAQVFVLGFSPYYSGNTGASSPSQVIGSMLTVSFFQSYGIWAIVSASDAASCSYDAYAAWYPSYSGAPAWDTSDPAFVFDLWTGTQYIQLNNVTFTSLSPGPPPPPPFPSSPPPLPPLPPSPSPPPNMVTSWSTIYAFNVSGGLCSSSMSPM